MKLNLFWSILTLASNVVLSWSLEKSGARVQLEGSNSRINLEDEVTLQQLCIGKVEYARLIEEKHKIASEQAVCEKLLENAKDKEKTASTLCTEKIKSHTETSDLRILLASMNASQHLYGCRQESSNCKKLMEINVKEKAHLEATKNELIRQKTVCEKQLETSKEKEVSIDSTVALLREECDLRISSNSESASYLTKIIQQGKEESEAKAAKCEQDLVPYKEKEKKMANCPAKDLPNHKKIEISTGTYFLSSEKVSWVKALQSCRQAGLDLVSIESEEENVLLAKSLPMSQETWSSGTDFGATKGKHYWSSTGNPFDGSFTDWNSGEPGTSSSIKDNCVVVYRHSSTPNRLSWYDYACHNAFLYLCELSVCKK